MTETAHRGSCLCGSIRYETTAALQAASHCHCTMCRKAHGAAFATYGSVRREHHRFVQGADQVRAYRSSAQVTRFFCPACGSPLLWHSDADHPDWVAVPLGSLDTPFQPQPTQHLHADTRAPWGVMGDVPSQV